MATPRPGEGESSLTASQQETVEQLMAITAQSEGDATALLRRSAWSVPVAISKFYDGETNTTDLDQLIRDGAPVDPQPPNSNNLPMVDLNDAYGSFPGARAPRQSVVDQAIQAMRANNGRTVTGPFDRAPAAPPVERTELAQRIVVPPPAPAFQPPFLIAILLAPLNLSYRLVAGMWRTVQYILGMVPGFGWIRRIGSFTPRRQLNPRDAAARFKREFEEVMGSDALPFVEMGYTQSFDKAKHDPMYLLAIVMSPEHDDYKKFCRDVLLHPDVVDFIKDPANNILLWGGSASDPEAYQVSLDHRTTKYPAMAMICVTPKEGGSTRMGIVKRLTGSEDPQELLASLRQVTEKYADDLASVRAVRIANESSRNIRAEQDNAYELSLQRDRERARQRREAEKLAREREEEAARQERLGKQWRIWRAANLAPEPAPGTANIVRVAIKLPQSLGGERLRRSFTDSATVEDLYAFVECYNVELNEEDGNEVISEKITKPEGYTHDYKFRIASMMPRELHEPSETKTLLEAIGKSASLVVEEVEESESGEEDRDQN